MESYPRNFVFSGFEEATLEDVRERAAEFLGAKRDEVAITRNTTEGMNMVAEAIQLKPGGMLPQAAILRQNYPNPFNASTRIHFELPYDGNVSLEVLDALGQVIAVPVRGWRSAGVHDLLWSGAGLASGLYFYRLVTEKDAVTRKMELVQ